MAVPISPKAKFALLGAIFATAWVAVYVFVSFLTDPEATDGCLVVYEKCRTAAAGFTRSADCAIELYHCRAFGEQAGAGDAPTRGGDAEGRGESTSRKGGDTPAAKLASSPGHQGGPGLDRAEVPG